MLNNHRYDLSDKLIHFFRPIDPKDGSNPVDLDSWEPNSIEEGGVLHPFFLLRVCIRCNVLWFTWSFRNRVRTIYGPDPAVCFTDMPFAAFFETSRIRSQNGEKISPYALFFTKKQMIKIGARPVIYGLSDELKSLPSGKNGRIRLIKETILPKPEQYRYVTYNPCGRPSIDWTHEREWRLPNRNSIDVYEKELKLMGCVDDAFSVPGLNLSSLPIDNIGIMVKTKDEQEKVIYDILSLIYRKEINSKKYRYVVCFDNIQDIDKLKDYNEQQELIKSSKIDINKFLKKNTKKADKMISKIAELENQIEKKYGFEEPYNFGQCWLWIYDFLDKKVQAMLNEGYLEVNKYGKILYKPIYISSARGLDQQEEMIMELAECVEKELGIKCGYLSVLNRGKPFDMDTIPFDASIILDERLDKLYNNYNIND